MKKRKFYKKKTLVERGSMVGKVLDVVRNESSAASLVQGVKKNEQCRYQPPLYHGSNGTYRVGFPQHQREVLVVVDVRGLGKRQIDIRNDALKVNGRERVTDRFVEQLREKLIGTELKVVATRYESYVVDTNDLVL